MNIEQANTIAIAQILETLGYKPAFETNTGNMYLSPFREEKTPSFHLNNTDNCWYDHGEGIGGDTVNFGCFYLKSKNEDYTEHDALRWLNNLSAKPFSFIKSAEPQEKESAWSIVRTEPLECLALIRYLKKRGINPTLAKKHLCEVSIIHKKKRFNLYALGFKNEDGGYELRNAFFKSSISPKTITFIRGSKLNSKIIHVFEGFMDYLTFLTIRKGVQEEDVIVLNSTSNIQHALNYMRNYGYELVCTWMDNNRAGYKASLAFDKFSKSEPGLTHKKMNNVYKKQEDFNAWHMHNLNLSL